MEQNMKKFYTAPDMEIEEVVVETALLGVSGSDGDFDTETHPI